MHISVIGTGYVGLVTGACFAEFGVNVTCMDSDARRVASLEKGDVPFYEPGIKEQIADMALNGSGIRDTSRVLGIGKNTVISNGTHLSSLHLCTFTIVAASRSSSITLL